MTVQTADESPTLAEAKAVARVQRAMSVPEAARRLGIGRTQLYSLLADGVLPSYRIGRRRLLDPADVEAFWRSCRCDGRPVAPHYGFCAGPQSNGR